MYPKTIYKRVFHFEVLSEYSIGEMTLDELNQVKDSSYMSGRFLDDLGNERLRGKEAVEAILAQGTDPEFFGFDREGNEIE